MKKTFVDDVKKTIIAFANSTGGVLYIGVADDGSVIGVDDPDGVSLQVGNVARDAIKPDVTMFMRLETVEENGMNIVAVRVQRGTSRPYYLAKKGMRPDGAYVRQGSASVPATDEAIRRMIKETNGERFEAMRSLRQDLTFDAAEKEFSLRNVGFKGSNMRSLGIVDGDGLYSNLGLLLSDQCDHTTKIAVFQGSDQAVFRDRREFSGSLFQQMNEVYEFIDLRNQTRSTIEGLLRSDVRDYPEIAVREALLNLLVHRDYSFSSSALISIYEDRIELVSIGGLMPGVDVDDIMLGISVCRNQGLANVFYRLRLIEAYGTGMGKIFGAYAKSSERPQIEVTGNAFKVMLPNMNAQRVLADASALQEKADSRLLNGGTAPLNDEAQVAEFMRVHGSIARSDVMALLDVSASTASRLLREMVENGVLRRVGKARSTKYTAV